jgi:hypothetical protein
MESWLKAIAWPILMGLPLGGPWVERLMALNEGKKRVDPVQECPHIPILA